MSKMDEQVLVFPACYQKYLVGLPGFMSHKKEPGNWGAFIKEIVPNMCFMRRGDVEEDPSMNQVIPYVIVRDVDRRVLLYNRGGEGGEARLADKWSIGVGGHINNRDVEFKNGLRESNSDFLFEAATREVKEELAGVNDRTVTPMMAILGCLYLTGTPVNEVHFGLILEAICKQPEEIGPTEEITELKWVAVDELKNYELEGWSAVLRDEFLFKEEE